MVFNFIALLVFANNVCAQTGFIVKGKVTSMATGAGLVAASVFALNTTLGVATAADGSFSLSLPNGGYDVAVSYTGYQTEVIRVTTATANDVLQIQLKEKEKELAVVSVIASNEVMDGLAKYGDFFKDEFIGKSSNAKRCIIVNPEVLHFFYSKKKSRLKITATEPLVIKNEVLGYSIKYDLDSFTHEYLPEISTYSGYPLYEGMPGDSLQQWQWAAARQQAYKGSILHFMRSVYNKTLAEQQFEMQYMQKKFGKDAAIYVKNWYTALQYQKDDSTQSVEIMPTQQEVGLLYLPTKPSPEYLTNNPTEPANFLFSILSFKPNESIVIEQNGYWYNQNDVTISGYWAWLKLANALPYDYQN